MFEPQEKSPLSYSCAQTLYLVSSITKQRCINTQNTFPKTAIRFKQEI